MAKRGGSVFDVLTDAVISVVVIGASAVLGGILVVKFAAQDDTNTTAITNLKDTILGYLDDPVTYVGILILIVIFSVFMGALGGMRKR